MCVFCEEQNMLSFSHNETLNSYLSVNSTLKSANLQGSTLLSNEFWHFFFFMIDIRKCKYHKSVFDVNKHDMTTIIIYYFRCAPLLYIHI